MKTKLLLKGLLMASSFFAFASSAHARTSEEFLPMFEQGKSWECVAKFIKWNHSSMFAPRNFTVYVDSDTVIDGKQYTRLKLCNRVMIINGNVSKDDSVEYTLAYQENGVVYVFKHEYQDFMPLFDFGAEIGQEFEFFPTVENVSSVNVNGIDRKLFTFEDYNSIYFWLEGIGTVDLDFIITPMMTTGLSYTHLQRCMKDGECLFDIRDFGGSLSFGAEGIYYKTTVDNNVSVDYIDIDLNPVIVPDKITDRGVTYTVTGVEELAFVFNHEVDEISLPESILSIEGNAFGECEELASLTVNATLPPEVKENSFMPVHFEQCTLYVPSGSVDAYSSAEIWKNFKTILPITTAINTTHVKPVNVRGEVIGTDGKVLSQIRRPDGVTAAECCEDLPSGIYMVRLTDNFGSTTVTRIAK